MTSKQKETNKRKGTNHHALHFHFPNVNQLPSAVPPLALTLVPHVNVHQLVDYDNQAQFPHVNKVQSRSETRQVADDKSLPGQRTRGPFKRTVLENRNPTQG